MNSKPTNEAQPQSSQGQELPQTLSECHEVITRQAVQLSQLQEQVGVLQERVKLDSTNSSKPPSSNGPGQGNRAQRRASQRKRGAQPGHKGSARAMLDEQQVDQIIDCKPGEVCECGAAVAMVGDEAQRHQVFDVPHVKAQVHEYRRYAGRCTGCGKAHRGALPAGVPSGQIGPRALALIGTLGTHYHLTQFKIRDLLARVLGVDFSVGAISQAHGKVAQALQAPVVQLGKHVAQAPVKHLDETRYPSEGGRRGADFIARGFSVYETCRRQGRDLWDFMHHAVIAWIDCTTAPSLLPSATPHG